MKLLPRTVRLDVSDEAVFAHAALPGEWAVAGGFIFVDFGQDVLSQAEHSAFACGFLGTESFGWSTLVSVEAASDDEVNSVIETLAGHFVDHLGAPSLDAAREAAREEVLSASGLCEHPIGTLLTVTRRFEDEQIVERFATITPHVELAATHASPIDLRALSAAGDEP